MTADDFLAKVIESMGPQVASGQASRLANNTGLENCHNSSRTMVSTFAP